MSRTVQVIAIVLVAAFVAGMVLGMLPVATVDDTSTASIIVK